MKNIKKVVLTLLLSVFALSFANATNVNAELRDLQRQIDRLSSKINNVGDGNSALSNISLSGRLFLTFNYDDNDENNDKHNIQNERTEVKISKTLDYGKYVVTLKKGDGNSIKFKDVGFYYSLNDNLTLAIGYLALPYSMEDDMNEGTRTRIGTSTYWFDTEAGTLGDGSGVGAYVSYLTNQYGIHFGVVGNSLDDSEEFFNPNTDDNAGEPIYSGKSQMTISSRVYYAPYVADNSAFMIGATGFYRKFGESYNGGDKLYADNFTKFSGELMFVMNNFALLGEYMFGKVKVANSVNNETENVDLTDYYVQASYVLTGENYGYDSGYFDSYTVANPVTDGGFGSFELFAGYYVDDFSDNNNALGLKTNVITAGLNWSPLNQFRLFFTYNNVNEENGKGAGEDNKYNEYKVSARMFF
jgi:phosphate-selective porin